MSVHRLVGSLFLALACAAPSGAGAQTAPPGSLAAQTKAYFTAVLHADGPTLANDTSRTFRLVEQDGTRLEYPAFINAVTRDFISAQNPMGVNVDVKSSSENGSNATETVNTLTWWWGVPSRDPMAAPTTERVYATHQLSWTKAATGTWQLDEDHITELNTTRG